MQIGERQKKQLQLLQDLTGYSNGIPMSTRVNGTSADESSQSPNELSLTRSLATPSEQSATSTPGKDYRALIRQHYGNTEWQIAESNGAPNPLQQCMESPEDPPQIHEKIGSEMPQLEITSSTEVAINQLLEKNFTVQDILEAGIKALSHQVVEKQSEKNSDESPQFPTAGLREIVKVVNQQHSFGDYLPDIYKSNLRVNQINLVAACVANLGMLGFTLDTLADEDVEWCFHNEEVNQSKPTSSKDYSHLKRDLQPTPAQLLYYHHPYIDCLPFPDFRERLIKMISMDPQIEYDYCKDLENDGLVCWGSTHGENTPGVGSGAPWDMRSWEAQPWFLKKWWMLVGGPEGDMYKQSRWWCEIRGDASSYPWQ